MVEVYSNLCDYLWMLKIDKISSGEYQIISSGTIVTFDSNPITLTLDDDGQALVIEITFDENAEYKILYEPSEDGKKMCLRLNGPIGEVNKGNSEPILLAESSDNKKLYVNFRVSKNKTSSPRLFHYTFYVNG